MTKFESRLTLYPPDETTARRMDEVKFWITFNRFYEYLQGSKSGLGVDLIRTLCTITDTRESVFVSLIQGFQKKSVRPSRQELILCLRWQGLSLQEIYDNFGIAKNTSRKYVEEYIQKGQPSLPPLITTPGFFETLEHDIKPLLLWLSACNHANVILKHDNKITR